MSLTFDKNDLFSWRVLRALAGEDVPWLDGAEDHIQVMRLDKGHVLFEVGQPHPYLYVVRQGCLKLLYRDADGDLCVRYLYWGGDGWHWGYRWLGNGWHANNPAAVSAS